MSWFPGTASTGRAELAQKRRRPLVLLRAGPGASGRRSRSRPPARPRSISAASAGSSCGSSPAPKWRSETWRRRVGTGEAGYTVTEMADEQSTEIFDDLYLGLRAGGALRKQRRGEPLTEEEQEALGRWQRLSTWRKGDRDQRLRRRHVRARLHPRRPDLRPLAEGLSSSTPARPVRPAPPPAIQSVPAPPTSAVRPPPAASAISSAPLRSPL